MEFARARADDPSMALPPPPPPVATSTPHGDAEETRAAGPSLASGGDGGGSAWAAPRRWIGLAAIVGLLGATAGFVWASGQSAEYTATARASFVGRVDIGAVDAERARILALLGDDLDTTVRSSATGATVTTDAPSGRNFIDLVVTSDGPDGLTDAAEAGARAIVDAEAATLVESLQADAEAERAAAASLDAEVDELEAEMAVWLDAEAAAEILRSDDDPTVREQAFIDARNANDAYWKAVRIRNALVDQQNEFVRNAERREAEAVNAASMTVSSSTAAEASATTSPLLGAIGGLFLGVALVLVAAAALVPRRR
ncbi:MAG: hypothetical protein AAGG08_01240 [Actinomycetota bacterium]